MRKPSKTACCGATALSASSPRNGGVYVARPGQRDRRTVVDYAKIIKTLYEIRYPGWKMQMRRLSISGRTIPPLKKILVNILLLMNTVLVGHADIAEHRGGKIRSHDQRRKRDHPHPAAAFITRQKPDRYGRRTGYVDVRVPVDHRIFRVSTSGRRRWSFSRRRYSA